MQEPTKPKIGIVKKIWNILGPGFITGVADDDPSGIVTYSQSGAQYGLGQLWTAVFMLPFLIAVQEMCARIALVTKKGLAENIKENFPKWVLVFSVTLLFLANTINIGADLGAMSAVVRLFIPAPFIFISLFFFVLILSLEVFIPYHKYAKILKWLTFTLCAYILTGLMVARGWRVLLLATFLPHITFNSEFFIILTGVIGTTISPYMFFWQARQEVEEEDDKSNPHVLRFTTKRRIAGMRLDTVFGMVFSDIATWFIIMTTALVLHANGIVNIQTAEQAAKALQPLVRIFPYSGTIAEALFAIGIIGTGLLAVPIFAATSAYSIAEMFHWHEGLSKTFKQAKGFYIIIILGTLTGLLLNLVGVNPIRALVYTAVLNGTVAPPLILIFILLANNKKLMGKEKSGFWSNVFCLVTFIGMSASILLMFIKI